MLLSKYIKEKYMFLNPYEVLGVSQSATLEEIKKARDSMIKTILILPDNMKQIMFPPIDLILDAYNVLSNHITRYIVDLSTNELEEQQLLILKEDFMQLLWILNLSDVCRESYINKYENTKTIKDKTKWYKFIQKILEIRYICMLNKISDNVSFDLEAFKKLPLEKKMETYQQGYIKLLLKK